jgi:hypothetical protein
VGLRAGLDDVEKRKFLTLPGLELVQPVVSRYTDSLYCTDKIPKYRNYWIVVHAVSMNILDCIFPKEHLVLVFTRILISTLVSYGEFVSVRRAIVRS